MLRNAQPAALAVRLANGSVQRCGDTEPRRCMDEMAGERAKQVLSRRQSDHPAAPRWRCGDRPQMNACVI